MNKEKERGKSVAREAGHQQSDRHYSCQQLVLWPETPNLLSLLSAPLCLLPSFAFSPFVAGNCSCCVIYILCLCAVTSALRTDSLLPSLSLSRYSLLLAPSHTPVGHLLLDPLSGFLFRSLWLQFAQMSR